MIRFWHMLFALPFTVMGAIIGGQAGSPGFCSWGKLGLIIICMVTAQTVGMLFNRYVDAQIDARNPRTANRHIPSGLVSKKTTRYYLALSSALFFAAATLFWKPLGPYFGYGNYWPIVLAMPALLLICSYSFTKRFTWASHFWLGLSLMAGPVGAYIAVSPPQGPIISWQILTLGGAVALWTAGFDIIYACQDIQIDRRDHLHSLPAAFGHDAALWVSRLCHLATATLWYAFGRQLNLGFYYNTAVFIAVLLLIFEHWLVRGANMKHIALAFGTINGTISILLAAALVVEIF